MGDVSVPAKKSLPIDELDTDFKREFPPDPLLGHELDDGARVWKVYRKEANAYDNDMLDGWGDTLDILLIFAGLFSAVVTAFVIESYALLQPDNTAYMATALYIIASANNASASLVLPPPPSLELSPSRSSRWINGLWFTSLLLSITVAFLCILIKQWIREYKSRNTASAQSPRHWARRREIFFKALKHWPIGELVSVLPVLLHLSLFLFFAGIIALLWPLDRAIGIWIVVLALLLVVFYAGCTMIPVWIPECPTSTPLAHMVRKLLIHVELFLLRLCAAALPRLRQYGTAALDILSRRVRRRGPRESPNASIALAPLSAEGLPTDSSSRQPRASRLQSIITTLKAQRSADAYFSEWSKNNCDDLDAAALQWAILEISDSDSVAVGLQALGALSPNSALAGLLRKNDRMCTFAVDTALTRSSGVQTTAEALRVLRSLLCMQGSTNDDLPFSTHLLVGSVPGETDYPDIALVKAFFNQNMSCITENATTWRTASSTLTSTAVLLMQATTHLANPVSWFICLLQCCEFGKSLDVDWLDIIPGLSLAQSASRRLRSKQFLFAELVAEAGIPDINDATAADSELTKASAHVIGRLLLEIPRSDYEFITKYSSLSNCLATGHFFPRDINVREFDERLFRIARELPRDSNMPLALWQAVTHVVRQGHLTRMGSDFAFKFCALDIDAALAGPVEKRDSRLDQSLTRVLCHVDIPDIDRSIWSMFSIDIGELIDTGLRWLILASELSTALCARQRNHDVHLNAYFAGCSSTNFLTVASRFWIEEKRAFDGRCSQDSWLRVIHHNSQLRRQWWKEIRDSHDDAYTKMIEVMDEEFRRTSGCESVDCPVHRPPT